jgi:putative membrane protein
VSTPRLSEHLANERTYLAYVRTSIALITFGITINRFSLFLIETRPSVLEEKPAPMVPAPRLLLGDTEHLGVGMVIGGLVLLVWSAIRYSRIRVQIQHDDYTSDALTVWFVTFGVLLLGVWAVLWLFQR